jgi:hypothetical protein
MLLTLLIERVVAESTSLWTSSMHSKDISERVWRPWSSLVCVPLSKHPKDLIDHEVLRWDPTGGRAVSHGPPCLHLPAFLSEESTPGQIS